MNEVGQALQDFQTDEKIDAVVLTGISIVCYVITERYKECGVPSFADTIELVLIAKFNVCLAQVVSQFRM